MPDSTTNSFRARFESNSASSFDANMIALRQFDRDHLFAFSEDITTSPDKNCGRSTSIASHQILPSDTEKSVVITFDSSISFQYCIGMYDLKFNDVSTELKDIARIVHKLHLDWLEKERPISWELFQSLSTIHSSDRTIAKCVKTKLQSTLNKQIISLACDLYHIGTNRVQSCSPLDIDYVFGLIHADHLLWINETTTIPHKLYSHPKETYHSDCFLSDSKYQVFAVILYRKNQLYMEQQRLDFENDYDTSFFPIIDTYSIDAEALFPPIDTIHDLQALARQDFPY